MAAMKSFVSTCDPVCWTFSYKLYEKILREKAAKKTKPAAGKELIELDKWYQNELPDLINSRKEKEVTSEELVKLMKWKLSRGKFRPRLVELAGSNSAEDVKKYSSEAFKKVDKDNLKGGIEALSKLKGIGPATASAVLAAGSPDKVAFMSDESTMALLGGGSLKYNTAEYLTYMDAINQCVHQLNENESVTEKWTPHKVELTLWTHDLTLKLKPDLLASQKRKDKVSTETEGTQKKKIKK